MRFVTMGALMVAAVIAAADIIRGSALAHWQVGQASIGMNLLKASERVNPFSLDVRLDQIESLFTGFRQTHNTQYLTEAALIAGGMVRDYPGNVQARAVHASALIFEATHGGNGFPLIEALVATRKDPLSVVAIERAMFLISAKRRDYDIFKILGVKRGGLTTERATMRCELCGRHWLKHP